MASIVSSFLHHSANKIDDFSKSKRKTKEGLGKLPQATLSTPTVTNTYYQQPQASLSAEYIAPPPYDPTNIMMKQQQQQFHRSTPLPSPVLTPSTSWTTDNTTMYEKSNNAAVAVDLDRRSISQGMKLVSIAADEYDEGNEAVALDIYLTGLDKILMALPNKTDTKTKLALREKLLSVEERVGILNLVNQRQSQNNTIHNNNNNNMTYSDQQQPQSQDTSSLLDALILGKITQTLQSVTQAAAKQRRSSQQDDQQQQQQDAFAYRHPYQTSSYVYPPHVVERFKQFGQVLIQACVTLAILVKQSPLPALLGFCLTYFMQMVMWVDAQYGVRQRAQELGVTGIKLLLQADEQYRLHEFVSEFLFMLLTAALKAIVAYRETPKYQPGMNNNNASYTFPPAPHPHPAVASSSSNTAYQRRASGPKLQEIADNKEDVDSLLIPATSSACPPSSSFMSLSSWVWPSKG